MLSPTSPWPLNIGSKIRIYHTIKELSLNHNITLITLVHNEKERDDADVLKQFCIKLYIIKAFKSRKLAALQSLFSIKPYRVVKLQSRKFKQKVNQLLQLETFDIIWVNFLNMAIYLNPLLTKQALIVLDQHNADELMWERYAINGKWGIRAFARQNIWKIRRFQNKILKYFDVTISPSELETEFMRKRVPEMCKVWTVPNGVDVDYFRPISPRVNKKRNIILFCGSMDVTMNIEASLRFSKEIFPLIKRSIPSAEFWIVGRNPERKVLKLINLEGVKVTGSVENVRPYYEKAKVVVAPFRYGAGTKLKVLEAMAMGVPVVSTDVGYKGIDAIPGRHLLVKNENGQIAECIIELVKNRRLREKICSAARKLVEEKYSWSFIMGNLIKQLESLVQHAITTKKTIL